MTQRLDQMERIRQHKARYCRLLDTKDFASWERILKPEATIVSKNVDGTTAASFAPAREFARVTRDLFTTMKTIHQTHNFESEWRSETVASVIWSMEDWHVPASDDNEVAKTLHGYGFYYETGEMIDGDWKLARMELRRTILFA